MLSKKVVKGCRSSLLMHACCCRIYLDSHRMPTCSVHSTINDAKLSRPKDFIRKDLIGFRNIFLFFIRLFGSTKNKISLSLVSLKVFLDFYSKSHTQLKPQHTERYCVLETKNGFRKEYLNIVRRLF